jgi:hypothetical protein
VLLPTWSARLVVRRWGAWAFAQRPAGSERRPTSALLAAWFAFGWGILEQLSMDSDPPAASDPQLWPEHFDPAIEIGDPEANRASYGFSPGDVSKDASAGPEPLPYLYVGPWFPDNLPDTEYWSGGGLAILRFGDLITEPDPAATAWAFLVEGRSQLLSPRR